MLKQERFDKLADDIIRHSGGQPETREFVSLLVANEVTDQARYALSGVLERLGGDGVLAYLNGATPEQMSDCIWHHVVWMEEQARAAKGAGA